MDQENISNLEQQRREEESDQEDALSLCDLSNTEYHTFDQFGQDFEEYEENFAFSFNNPFVTVRNDRVLDDHDDDNAIKFCGKIIGCKQDASSTAENQRRLKKSLSSETSTGSNRYSYSSSKCSSRKHIALIGLVKIPTEMDLSDIKRRQSKRRNSTTPKKLPVAAVGEPAVAGDDGSGGSERRRSNNRWGGARSLPCGTRFANLFAKTALSCGSFSLVRVIE